MCVDSEGYTLETAVRSPTCFDPKSPLIWLFYAPAIVLHLYLLMLLLILQSPGNCWPLPHFCLTLILCLYLFYFFWSFSVSIIRFSSSILESGVLHDFSHGCFQFLLCLHPNGLFVDPSIFRWLPSLSYPDLSPTLQILCPTARGYWGHFHPQNSP